MYPPPGSLYEETERRVRRSLNLLVVVSLLVVGLVWAVLFVRESYLRLEQDRSAIAAEYLAERQSILRERVETVTDFIVTYRRQAEARLRAAVQGRVDAAHGVALALIESHPELDQAAQQQLVIAALRPLRWRGGASYLWINDYDLNVWLFPTEPFLEGGNLGADEVVRRQAETARAHGSGFNQDAFRRPDGPADEARAQISYVRDLGHWGWYLGSAEFLDDFEADLQAELLEVVAQFRYGDNYIFIDTFDGYAILMNGHRLDPPQYAWELEDANGLPILQEQLRVARASPEGGFLSYVWEEASLGRPMEYLSFVRVIEDWGWKIGTGTYLEPIEEEIAARQADLTARSWTNVTIGSGLVLGVLLAVLLAARGLSRRIGRVLAALRANVELSRKDLVSLNVALEDRVRAETERRVALHQLSITDALTGLANRRHFDDVLDAEWRRAVRLERPLALILADIDHFKRYNDALGHPAGDAALALVGETLRKVLRRAGDVAARYGGEELAVILPETSLEGAHQVARRIAEEVNRLGLPTDGQGDGAPLSLSLGVASLLPRPGEDPALLVEAADQALYAAKRNGRNRIELAG